MQVKKRVLRHNDGPIAGISSISVLIGWLTTSTNYNRYRGGEGQNGESMTTAFRFRSDYKGLFLDLFDLSLFIACITQSSLQHSRDTPSQASQLVEDAAHAAIRVV
ncbi:unnamed protein product [Phytophthora fragariaefolia]|uniref:Unnamed protein product n=1 Tax=Phytophthora fragariaefolia TaxID=1490495 RepID=A0A9W6Y4N5_9STRA|nr:unnamed protein product [Phytophthora fragariaefolia]